MDTTWRLAFERIAKASPAATQLLHLCAFLAPEGITPDLLGTDPALLPDELGRAVTDPLELEDAIAVLYRYSLIGRDQTGLRVHRLVQAVVASSLLTEERSLWIERAVGLLLVAMPADPDQPQSWPCWARLLAHVMSATAHAQHTRVALADTAELLNQAGVYPKGLGINNVAVFPLCSDAARRCRTPRARAGRWSQ
ncbi:MAG: hypothetical protein ACRDYX_11030 [Egibacteraceae bacterium]